MATASSWSTTADVPWLTPPQGMLSHRRPNNISADITTRASLESTEISVLSSKLLEKIPIECWCLILGFVPPARLVCLRQVCSRWKSMIEEDLVAPVWKALALQCHLGQPEGLIKTYQQLVLGHTLVICEVCLQRPKKCVGSTLPLPIDRKDNFGRAWMCRLCRRRYFDTHPEPERPSQPSDYEGHIGALGGAGFWSVCSVPMAVPTNSASATSLTPGVRSSNSSLPSLPPSDQRQEETQQEQPQRPECVSVVMPLDSPYCLAHADHIGQVIVSEARRHYGGDIGIAAHHGESKTDRLLSPLRHKLMSTLLGLSGLRLRTDSKLCGRYLAGSRDDPFRIADVMAEMDWYFNQTDYTGFVDLDYGSAEAKAAALLDWLEDTVAIFGGTAKAKDGFKRNGSDLVDGIPHVYSNTRLEFYEPPPRSLWTLLDSWLDHWLQGENNWKPLVSIFEVDCEISDRED
ncbi:hypothetical protein BGZ99_002162 [Dissophora globulifera]|uniref:F-box domain-containing protein n=1 Tax=Dissophora globulifera TaxID=979702 RepID=A0A9P6UWI0_9FUNG|nr:hypothetical protein BGZ99_002162 [Dissophora globulifera]